MSIKDKFVLKGSDEYARRNVWYFSPNVMKFTSLYLLISIVTGVLVGIYCGIGYGFLTCFIISTVGAFGKRWYYKRFVEE